MEFNNELIIAILLLIFLPQIHLITIIILFKLSENIDNIIIFIYHLTIFLIMFFTIINIIEYLLYLFKHVY